MPAQLPSDEEYLQVLSRFPRYIKNAWRNVSEGKGYFGDPSNDEPGMRSTGNVIFTAALLAREGYPKTLGPGELPPLTIARSALAYMTGAHSTGNSVCGNGRPWTGGWQSSWWATRMALGARLVWDLLSEVERTAVERVVVFEADRHLGRIAPSGLFIDTKAEETAWDCEILATASALFPGHPRRDLWWEKLCEFGYNSLSVAPDRLDHRVTDGKPLSEWVHSVNVHTDFTLENHGSYHFCYVASPLHSLAWSTYALVSRGITPPQALSHHVADLWQRVKPTFLGNRFAYVSGQDWARYTYGEYFIVPASVWLQSLLNDPFAATVEKARFDTLAWEQKRNQDGSFFGERFTWGHYTGQQAKYETDCFANLALAYCLRKELGPKVLPAGPDLLDRERNLCHVSHEAGVAFTRTPDFFASFSWKTLVSSHPTALFVPHGRTDLAEWQQSNLLGRIVTVDQTRAALWISSMKQSGPDFTASGTIVHLNGQDKMIYTQEVFFQTDAAAKSVRVKSKFTAHCKLFVVRSEGLCLAVANDIFNGCTRTVEAEGTSFSSVFDPSDRGVGSFLPGKLGKIFRRLMKLAGKTGKTTKLLSGWVRIDGTLGIVDNLGHPEGFSYVKPTGRNVSNHSLHFDLVVCPAKNWNKTFQDGEVILETDFLLSAIPGSR